MSWKEFGKCQKQRNVCPSPVDAWDATFSVFKAEQDFMLTRLNRGASAESLILTIDANVNPWLAQEVEWVVLQQRSCRFKSHCNQVIGYYDCELANKYEWIIWVWCQALWVSLKLLQGSKP